MPFRVFGLDANILKAVQPAGYTQPTRELVAQIEENVRAYARFLPLRAATIYGGVSERPQLEALWPGSAPKALAASLTFSPGPEILVAREQPSYPFKAI